MISRRKRLCIALILMTVLITACSRIKDKTKYEETQIKMGTAMTIKAYGENGEQAVSDAFKRIDEIERLTSLNISTSEVTSINNAAGKRYVKVSPEVFELIKESMELSKMSQGAFDITIGPLVKLWNFGTKDARVPSSEEIKEKLSLVGYEKIKINEKESSVMLEKPGMMIDLGGIAKGHAADQVVDILVNYGIKSSIINLGGSNVFVLGEKNKQELWTIGIQHPRKVQGDGFLALVKESDKAVATSGDYERYFMVDGKRYHHIIDPKTGYPADNGIMSDSLVLDSTLVKNSSMIGDALSTAVLILGPDKGLRLIESLDGVEGLIATSDYKLLISSGMDEKIESISEDFEYDAQRR